ncbi:hypothetical protein ACXN5S_13890 [Pseudoroseicyclus sp. H15]
MAETESNRDRVRRLLYAPLGFRTKRGEDAEAHGRLLDGLADDLAYLSDDDLKTLRRMVEVHGDGAKRDIWPSMATFRGLAQIVRPRPLAELPALRSWFASVEGPRARAAGTLVETAQFFERKRVPPYKPGDRQLILERAQENGRRLALIEEREAGGWSLTDDDVAWARAYKAQRAWAEALIDELAKQKGTAA